MYLADSNVFTYRPNTMHRFLKGQFFVKWYEKHSAQLQSCIEAFRQQRDQCGRPGAHLHSQLYLRKISSCRYRTEQLQTQILKTYLIKTRHNSNNYETSRLLLPSNKLA